MRSLLVSTCWIQLRAGLPLLVLGPGAYAPGLCLPDLVEQIRLFHDIRHSQCILFPAKSILIASLFSERLHAFPLIVPLSCFGSCPVFKDLSRDARAKDCFASSQLCGLQLVNGCVPYHTDGVHSALLRPPCAALISTRRPQMLSE